MPWTYEDARKHTKRADTVHKQRLWAEVANKALDRGEPEDVAIKEANATVAKVHHWT